MPEDVKPHKLFKQQMGTFVTIDDVPIVTVTTTNAWDAFINAAAGGFATVAVRDYIDLEGWSASELTTFVQGVDIQKSLVPAASGATSPSYVVEMDLLTTRR